MIPSQYDNPDVDLPQTLCCVYIFEELKVTVSKALAILKETMGVECFIFG